jgi:transposase InsO family protein
MLRRQRRNGVVFLPAAKNVLNRRSWTTRQQLRLAIITWIENTYDRRRPQHTLGRLTPIEFEILQQAAHPA